MTSIAIGLATFVLTRIFNKELIGFADRVRNAKPQNIGVTPVIGS